MKIGKKICALMVSAYILFSGSFFLHAQETQAQESGSKEVSGAQSEEQSTAGNSETDNTEAEHSQANKPSPGKLIFTAGAVGILNTEKQGAPSPIRFTIGAGARFPIHAAGMQKLYFAPHGNFFDGYYLWDGTQKKAVPAEVEQRAAYVPAIMVDTPVVFAFARGRSVFSAGAGISLLVRFAAPALRSGVSASDLQEMNGWFWKNGRFVYPSVQFSWDYLFPSGLSAGVGAKAYLSAGALADKRGLDRSMLIVGIRIVPPAM